MTFEGQPGVVIHRCRDDEPPPPPIKYKQNKAGRVYAKYALEQVVKETPGLFACSDFVDFGFRPRLVSEYLKRMAADGVIVNTGKTRKCGNGRPPLLYCNFK